MKLKPVRRYRNARTSDEDLRWINAARLLRHDAEQSLTDAEDGSDIDVTCPLDLSCHTFIPRPDQVLAARLDELTISREARFVVGLVLETPAEAIDLLYDSFRQRVTRQRLLSYLRRHQRWSPLQVRRVFTELAEYVEELGT